MEPTTLCAPAARAPREKVVHQVGIWAGFSLLRTFLNSAAYPILVLNAERQIVLFNAALRDILGPQHPPHLYGLRPGEALECVHAAEMPFGCGTSQSCNACGAVSAILAAQSGEKAARECSIIRRSGGQENTLEIMISALPVSVAGQEFVICSLVDLRGEKRRQTLERVLFSEVRPSLENLEHLAEGPAEPIAKELARLIAEIDRQTG